MIYRNELLRLSNNLSALQDLLTPIWLIYFFTKSLIIQCLQCYCLWSNEGGRTGASTSSFSSTSAQDDPLHKASGSNGLAYDSLVALGSVYRELGSTAVFLYSFYTGILIFYPKCPIFRGGLAEVYKKELVEFLLNSAASKRLIVRQIEESVDMALYSNFNYLKLLLALVTSKTEVLWPQLMAPDIQQTRSTTNNSPAYKSAPEDNLLEANAHESHMSSWLQDNSELLKMSPTVRRQIEGLRRQCAHLLALKRPDSRVWPPNRRAARRKELSVDFLRLELMVFLIFYLVGIGTTIMAQMLGMRAIRSNGGLPEEQRRFSVGERVMLVDQLIHAFLVTYWFTTPIVMLVVVFRDQTITLKWIKEKFRNYHILVGKLSHLKQERHLTVLRTRMRMLQRAQGESIRLAGQSSPSGHDEQNSWQRRVFKLDSVKEQTRYGQAGPRPEALEPEKEEEELKFSCDKEALEIYIGFRMFLAQIDAPMQLAQKVMLRNVIFVVSSLAVTLVFFRGIKSDHLNLLIILIILVMVLVDAALCVCAKFSSTCVKTFGLAFSLIARTLNHQQVSESFRSALRAAAQDDLCEDRARRLSPLRWAPPTAAWREQAEATTRCRQLSFTPFEIMSNAADANHLFECPISPHTLLLWRRLARDHAPPMSRFVLTVAGFLELDFRNILRFNFWIISIVLLALTSR